MPPRTPPVPRTPFWDSRYEGETVTGPRDTGMQASDFWFFLSNGDTTDDVDDEDSYVQVNITPIGYTQATGAMWDQSMDLDYLLPDLALGEIMEGVWETDHSWAAVEAAMLQAGFRPLPRHYLDGWDFAPEQLAPPGSQPGDEPPAPSVQPRTGVRTLDLDAPDEPPKERRPAWSRLLDDED